MKLKVILLSLFLTFSAQAIDVTFEWDPNAPEDNVASYVLWERTAAGDVQKATVAGNQVIAAADFAKGAHTVYVTAVSQEGIHSLPSNAVTFNIVGNPKNFRIKLNQ